MNMKNNNLIDNNSKKIKPGGILKKNKTPTKKNNNKNSDEFVNFKLKNMSSAETLNLNETANTVEYTIENLSPIRGNSLLETNQLVKSIRDDINSNSKNLNNNNKFKNKYEDSARLRDSVESDINILSQNRANNLNIKRINN